MLEYIESVQIFGENLINVSGFSNLALRLIINLLTMYLIVSKIFKTKYQDRQFAFTYYLINISIFLVCILLVGVKLKIGFAFGLFAVFSIIRYRTEQIPIRNMTYLFVIIIIAILNSLTLNKVSYAEIILTNSILVGVLYLLEHKTIIDFDAHKIITYEKIENIKPQNYELLIEDLKERTGLDIKHAQVNDVNFLNDTAVIKIFYKSNFKGPLS